MDESTKVLYSFIKGYMKGLETAEKWINDTYNEILKMTECKHGGHLCETECCDCLLNQSQLADLFETLLTKIRIEEEKEI